MKENEFYTLKGYQLRNNVPITEAMEDYLEMIYRHTFGKTPITIKVLSTYLNVKPSSASKMITRLKEQQLVDFQKYGVIHLTEKGKEIGSYLLWRHNILTKFFQKLNGDLFSLEQVEKIEHFIDTITLQNIEKLLNQ